mmetsp:Transcript_135095/g.431269  ORF Transcript_135095/g.431269 Transcript_135095/m.431269 type:complete len:262 (+) Transcript_135095:1386-2171(+)
MHLLGPKTHDTRAVGAQQPRQPHTPWPHTEALCQVPWKPEQRLPASAGMHSQERGQEHGEQHHLSHDRQAERSHISTQVRKRQVEVASPVCEESRHVTRSAMNNQGNIHGTCLVLCNSVHGKDPDTIHEKHDGFVICHRDAAFREGTRNGKLLAGTAVARLQQNHSQPHGFGDFRDAQSCRPEALALAAVRLRHTSDCIKDSRAHVLQRWACIKTHGNVRLLQCKSPPDGSDTILWQLPRQTVLLLPVALRVGESMTSIKP